jgi:hypothetical protein
VNRREMSKSKVSEALLTENRRLRDKHDGGEEKVEVGGGLLRWRVLEVRRKEHSSR